MKIRVWVSTDKVGSRIERIVDIPDDHLDGLSDDERNQAIDEIAQEYVQRMTTWNWDKVADERQSTLPKDVNIIGQLGFDD